MANKQVAKWLKFIAMGHFDTSPLARDNSELNLVGKSYEYEHSS